MDGSIWLLTQAERWWGCSGGVTGWTGGSGWACTPASVTVVVLVGGSSSRRPLVSP
jgi:hypothetical protein